jgi:probable F420-dependent oxidoreductase
MKVRMAASVGAGPPDPDTFGAVVERAEALGFDTLWMADLPSLPATEPTAGIAFAAARTSRARLGANMIPFGARPYLVAHRLAQLDQLTGGRLLLTLVPGIDLPDERTALGTAGRHRGRMMEALVPLLRRWWRGEPASEGEDKPPVTLPVLPRQQPLEVWLAGTGPDAVGRAGRVADGWLGAFLAPRHAGEVRRAIEAEAEVAGRRIDPEHFGMSLAYARSEGDLEQAGRLRAHLGRVPRRDPGRAGAVPVGGQALRRLLEEHVEEGISKFVLRPLVPPPAVEGWSEELAWLADAVLGLQT